MSFFEVLLCRILIYFLSYLLAVVAGHLLVRDVMLKRHRPQQAGGIPGGGASVGAVERVLTLTFVLLGQYEALALILAAKSIARFEELKTREFAEYYLIGTLSSITFAMLVGIFTSWLLSLV